MKRLVSLRAAVSDEANRHSSLLVRFEHQPWILLGLRQLSCCCAQGRCGVWTPRVTATHLSWYRTRRPCKRHSESLMIWHWLDYRPGGAECESDT